MVISPRFSSGKAERSVIVAGFSGGNMAGSNVIVSPLWASSMACRNVPGPASAVLLTTIVSPRIKGAADALVLLCTGAVTTISNMAIAPARTRFATAQLAKRNALFILHSLLPLATAPGLHPHREVTQSYKNYKASQLRCYEISVETGLLILRLGAGFRTNSNKTPSPDTIHPCFSIQESKARCNIFKVKSGCSLVCLDHVRDGPFDQFFQRWKVDVG